MAGQTPEDRKNTDILFELTPEDNAALSEADLLTFVNYGQLSRSYDFPGKDGKNYVVTFSILWEEDYIDILQRTTRYAADPILRSKVMRRLILFKAIQSINEKTFTNPEDSKAKRLLWTMLCRMSSIMIQMLEARYKELELENDMAVMEAIQALQKKMDDTKPDTLKKAEKDSEKKAEEPEQNPHLAPFDAGREHAELVEQMKNRQAASAKDIKKVLGNQVSLEENKQPISTPKK